LTKKTKQIFILQEDLWIDGLYFLGAFTSKKLALEFITAKLQQFTKAQLEWIGGDDDGWELWYTKAQRTYGGPSLCYVLDAHDIDPVWEE
jgi:hypothetical protein